MEKTNKKNIIDEIRSQLDEIEDKLKQGSDAFIDNYRVKKEKIALSVKKYAHEVEQTGEEKVQKIKKSAEELLDLLESDYNLSYTEYRSESHKISKALDVYEMQVKDYFNDLSKEARKKSSKFEAEMKTNIAKMRMELDIQNAHFKGTADRMKAEYETWKANRLMEIDALKKQLELKKDIAEDRLEEFAGELTESFDHLKKAFKKLW